MRRYIYRAELDLYFHRSEDISQFEIDRIKGCLFRNPNSSHSKQYELRSEIISIDQIDEILKKGDTNKLFKSGVKDIFEITEDLKIDRDLKRILLGEENVAVFIGAGVSKLLGYPLWNDLASMSLDTLKEKKMMSFSERERIKAEIADPKQILSIFDKLFPRSSEEGRKFYEESLKKGLEIGEDKNPYRYIASPYFDWITITSNVDKELVTAKYKIYKEKESDSETGATLSAQELLAIEEFERLNVIHKEFPDKNLDSDKSYYLHGIISSIGETIFTTDDYIKNYFSDESKLRKFLKHLFEYYHVVFIGYGLAEFPILEAVISENGKQHFALIPTLYNERDILQIKTKYYSQFKVKPIPYYIDIDGYDRLIFVLSSWEKELIKEKEEGDSPKYLYQRDFLDNVL